MRFFLIAAAYLSCIVGLDLDWMLAQAPDVIPIPGTKHIDRLEENLGALRVRLSPAEVDRIDRSRGRHPLPRRRHAWRVYLRIAVPGCR